jgi:hypothetical protein
MPLADHAAPAPLARRSAARAIRADLYAAAAVAGRTTIPMYEVLRDAQDRQVHAIDRLESVKIAMASVGHATGARDAAPSCGWVSL